MTREGWILFCVVAALPLYCLFESYRQYTRKLTQKRSPKRSRLERYQRDSTRALPRMQTFSRTTTIHRSVDIQLPAPRDSVELQFQVPKSLGSFVAIDPALPQDVPPVSIWHFLRSE